MHCLEWPFRIKLLSIEQKNSKKKLKQCMQIDVNWCKCESSAEGQGFRWRPVSHSVSGTLQYLRGFFYFLLLYYFVKVTAYEPEGPSGQRLSPVSIALSD